MNEPLYMLNANICVYVLGGVTSVLRDRIENCAPGEIITSAIAFAAVTIGAARREKVEEAERFFRHFPVWPFDDSAARTYAGLPFRRAALDRLIAAHALALDVTLITNNERDFADLPALKIENWTR